MCLRSTHSVSVHRAKACIDNVLMQIARRSFYRAMQHTARYCHGKSSVCLSVRPPVCLSIFDVNVTYVGIL